MCIVGCSLKERCMSIHVNRAAERAEGAPGKVFLREVWTNLLFIQAWQLINGVHSTCFIIHALQRICLD